MIVLSVSEKPIFRTYYEKTKRRFGIPLHFLVVRALKISAFQIRICKSRKIENSKAFRGFFHIF
ncbi:hypothetical protein DLM78_01545 [Leptospira stimsonii]|uniref:Uncharacterized protein n=1 Tax=Leptospira stimsonii TaxID=2202203 RepID=A0A8B3CSM8_9LEPT|nr:hypothetical protein DLM78_01545 [Leptospira stimsonii]